MCIIQQSDGLWKCDLHQGKLHNPLLFPNIPIQISLLEHDSLAKLIKFKRRDIHAVGFCLPGTIPSPHASAGVAQSEILLDTLPATCPVEHRSRPLFIRLKALFSMHLKKSLQHFAKKILRAFEIVQQEGVNGIFGRVYYRYLIGHHWNALIKLNLWNSVYHLNPIIIHQMGKVGSKTVKLSLEKAYENIRFIPPVLHSHVLTNLDDIELAITREFGDNGRDREVIRDARQLNSVIFNNPHFRWSVISLVRDPVARNVGTFFDNLPMILPDWKQYYNSSEFNIRELQDIFLETGPIHSNVIGWFDHQLKPVFDVDVFATPFPQSTGYHIYHSSRADLLLLRLEDLDRVAPQAMDEFLGLKDFKIYNANVAEDKDYAAIYRDFKQAGLPAEYVDRIYGSKIATHFYSQAELKAFREKWVIQETT